MYGLDKKTDLSFLKDKRLIQICFGMHQLILNFDEGVSIMVEGKIDFLGENQSTHREVSPVEPGPLMSLLNHSIETLKVMDEGTLELTFTNRSTLKLYDSNPDTESYQIGSQSGTIVV